MLRKINIYELVNAFEACSLPKDEWHHSSHLRITLFYILNTETIFEVIHKVRCNIIRYGASLSKDNLCIKKYNETITIFWINEVHKFVLKNKDRSIEKLDELLSASELNSKDYILKFYSKDTLDGITAKAVFFSP